MINGGCGDFDLLFYYATVIGRGVALSNLNLKARV